MVVTLVGTVALVGEGVTGRMMLEVLDLSLVPLNFFSQEVPLH